MSLSKIFNGLYRLNLVRVWHGTGPPSPDHATITVSRIWVSSGRGVSNCSNNGGLLGLDIRETVSRLPTEQAACNARVVFPSWQVPTAPPSSGQALVGQLPTVEGLR